ncbi:CCD62 protein, partial [Rhinopomastus cyanomelas]|nr:CCD62 protein [Rhinopomastus cyanomelas]
STIQKQREAFQPLVAELQDADKELSDIVVAHQSDHLSWEGNGRKIPTLAEQCNILKNEVNKRNETIKSLTLKLDKMSQEITDATIQRQALEKENQSLEHDVLELSIKRGQLQAKERMLLAMLKMKDEVILERIDHITKFTTKFGQLASALHAAKIEKLSLNKENEDLKVRLRDLTPEAGMLKDHLSEKVKENKKQHEEIAHLKEENSSLREEAAIAVDRVRRQDQLLKSAKTKQAQTDTELSRLRQV